MDGAVGDVQSWDGSLRQMQCVAVAVSEQLQRYEHTIEPYLENPTVASVVDADAVAALPSSERDHGCVICLTSFAAAQGCELPCGHDFHRACVSPWLVKHGDCPLCRHACCRLRSEEPIGAQNREYALACQRDTAADTTFNVQHVRKMRLLRFA